MASLVDDHDLIAFYHRRLSAPQAQHIGALLESDPDIATRYRALRAEIETLSAAVSEPWQAAPPSGAEAMIRSAMSASRAGTGLARRSWTRRLGWVQAMAATVLLCVGLAGGFALSEWRRDLREADYVTALGELSAARTQSLQAALNNALSGEPYALAAADRQWAVQITPVRTFRNSNGAFCREFVEEWELAGDADNAYRIACRDQVGHWEAVATLQQSG